MEFAAFLDLVRDAARAWANTPANWWIGVTYVTAALACYAYQQFAMRIAEVLQARQRLGWLVGGAVATGGGMWAMYFLAMVADVQPLPAAYDPVATILSVVPSILATGIVLLLAAQPRVTFGQLVIGAVAAGSGTGAMHYGVVVAMRLDAAMRFEPTWFLVSIAATAALAGLALRARLWIGRTAGRYPTLRRDIASAAILGVAVTALFHGVIASTSYATGPNPARHALGIESEAFAVVVAIAVVLMLLIAITAVVLERARQNAVSFRFLFRKNPNAMWVHDLATYRIIEANEAACAAYGYKAEEFRRLRVFDVICVEDHDRLRAQMADASADTGMRDRGLWRHRTKDGRLIDVAITAGSIAFGHRHARLVLAKDVTQQRLTEARLAQAEASLRQSQKLEAIGQLTGGVAHDFNNVLAIMMTKLERLADELPAESPAQATIASALGAGERAAGVVSRLMTFARRRPLEAKETALPALFDELAGSLPSATSSGVRLSLDIAGDLHRCRLDRDGLAMAVVNLTENARDAMPDGGSLRITARNRAIAAADVEICPELRVGHWVEIAVSDSGVGMSAEIQARIFEPFFTTKGDGKGTGLGLAMVYGFVHQSGGFITLRSAPGRGTTVSIYLPAIAPLASRLSPGADAARLARPRPAAA